MAAVTIRNLSEEAHRALKVRAERVRVMINKTGRILTPARAVDRPHPHFLRWHRQNCFKA